MGAQVSAPIQHAVRKRREATGINRTTRHENEPPRSRADRPAFRVHARHIRRSGLPHVCPWGLPMPFPTAGEGSRAEGRRASAPGGPGGAVRAAGAAITAALIVGGLSAPEVAGVMRQFWAGPLDVTGVLVDRAIERGEHRSGRVHARDVGTAVLPTPGHLRTGHRTGRGPRCRRRAGRRPGRRLCTPPDSAG
jgi:hypothetical protein